MTDDIVGHCFDIDYFMDMCQKPSEHDTRRHTRTWRRAHSSQ